MRADRGRWGLFAAVAAADVGIKLSYTPLLALLLPAKAQALYGASAPLVLSTLALAGGAAASVVNVGVGWLGDRAGRAVRPRWLAGGALAVCASYVFLGEARTPAALLAAVLVLQVAINVTLSPLTVLVADRFFRRPGGFVVGAGGASQPVAGFVGAAVTAALIPFGPAAYVATGLLTAALILPLALSSGREAPGRPAAEPAPGPAPPADAPHGWRRLWAWRFCLALTTSLSAPYALFRLREELGGVGDTAQILAFDVSALTLLSSCAHLAAAVATAWAGTRGFPRRDAARLAAAVLCVAMLAFLSAHDAAGFGLAFALTGLGAGVCQASDAQLALALLPSRRTLGRDLGLLNLANTAPQMLAPMLAFAAPGVREGRVGALFALAALSSLAAAAMAGGMDRAPPLHRRLSPFGLLFGSRRADGPR